MRSAVIYARKNSILYLCHIFLYMYILRSFNSKKLIILSDGLTSITFMQHQSQPGREISRLSEAILLIGRSVNTDLVQIIIINTS